LLKDNNLKEHNKIDGEALCRKRLEIRSVSSMSRHRRCSNKADIKGVTMGVTNKISDNKDVRRFTGIVSMLSDQNEVIADTTFVPIVE